eukprot:TRINITY_DN27736_c0_g1_i1.p1 TRINITY_DN27736_c0_g1~~TRINITY_DN27736_c0_g1_i1.p1  ORF type:complete len:324 (+),score=27.30 TRINITY_DN27736_c0_g1_i1:37-972(+)
MKTGYPYSSWKIANQAAVSGMGLWKRVQYDARAYPGYVHKHTNRNQSAIIQGAQTHMFVRTTDPKWQTREVLATSQAAVGQKRGREPEPASYMPPPKRTVIYQQMPPLSPQLTSPYATFPSWTAPPPQHQMAPPPSLAAIYGLPPAPEFVQPGQPIVTPPPPAVLPRPSAVLTPTVPTSIPSVPLSQQYSTAVHHQQPTTTQLSTPNYDEVVLLGPSPSNSIISGATSGGVFNSTSTTVLLSNVQCEAEDEDITACLEEAGLSEGQPCRLGEVDGAVQYAVKFKTAAMAQRAFELLQGVEIGRLKVKVSLQ